VALKYVRLAWQSLGTLLRVKPQVIMHSGPGIAIPIALLGKIAGAKIIYVENGARVRTPSRSGRLMYRIADLFFVQWPELKAALPNAIYAGSLHQ
jgi:UDP-N-acetylglucosamine:LPS N-acetylglucosamine transferase